MKPLHIGLLVIGFILFLFGAVFTFTRETVFQEWGLSSSGQIGDTIGGITAPIINIVGSFLIFISFLSQNKANRIQADQNSFSLFHDLYKDLKGDFNNISFASSTIKDGKIYHGKKALSVFCETLESRITNEEFKNNSFFNEFLFLTGSFGMLLDMVKSSNMNAIEKTYILRSIHFLYTTKIKEHVVTLVNLTSNKEMHNNFHSILYAFDNRVEENFKENFENKRD